MSSTCAAAAAAASATFTSTCAELSSLRRSCTRTRGVQCVFTVYKVHELWLAVAPTVTVGVLRAADDDTSPSNTKQHLNSKLNKH